MKKSFLKKTSQGLFISVILGMAAAGFAAEWQKPVYVPSDGQSKGARVTYEYKVDSLFRVNTKLGYVNDIELKPGEMVTHIVGGDTKRWMIDKAVVGNVQHVYIKPIEPNIETNIIVNTNQRAYRLYVVTGENYDPLISFTFPDSPSTAYSAPRRTRETDMDVRLYGKNINRNYEIRVKKKADKALIPLEIFDDGRQTFIRMSKENRYDLPVLYNIDPWDKKNITMVNYRVQGDYFVADGVYPQGRLFYRQNFWIDFFNLERKPTVKGTLPANDTSRSARNRVTVSDNTDDSPAWREIMAEQSRKENKEPVVTKPSGKEEKHVVDNDTHTAEKAALEKKLEAERKRAEKLEQELAKQREREAEKERRALEREKAAEQERMERQRVAEQERQAALERERAAKELQEKQRIEREERLERQRLEKQLAAEQARREALERERAEQALREQQRREQEERLERQRLEREERLAREKAEQDKLEAERLRQQQAEREAKTQVLEERRRAREADKLERQKDRQARIEKRMWERLEQQAKRKKGAAGDAVAPGLDPDELRRQEEEAAEARRKEQLEADARQRQAEYDREYAKYLRKQKEAERKARRGGYDE